MYRAVVAVLRRPGERCLISWSVANSVVDAGEKQKMRRANRLVSTPSAHVVVPGPCRRYRKVAMEPDEVIVAVFLPNATSTSVGGEGDGASFEFVRPFKQVCGLPIVARCLHVRPCAKKIVFRFERVLVAWRGRRDFAGADSGWCASLGDAPKLKSTDHRHHEATTGRAFGLIGRFQPWLPPFWGQRCLLV